MSITFKKYRKSGSIEARELSEPTVIQQYKGDGSMSGGVADWLARDPNNHEDQRIIDAAYFSEHYELSGETQ